MSTAPPHSEGGQHSACWFLIHLHQTNSFVAGPLKYRQRRCSAFVGSFMKPARLCTTYWMPGLSGATQFRPTTLTRPSFIILGQLVEVIHTRSATAGIRPDQEVELQDMAVICLKRTFLFKFHPSSFRTWFLASRGLKGLRTFVRGNCFGTLLCMPNTTQALALDIRLQGENGNGIAFTLSSHTFLTPSLWSSVSVVCLLISVRTDVSVRKPKPK